MPRQPTLGRLHGIFFFFSRTLIEITIPGFWIKRDQKSVFSLTLCLSHIIIPHDIRCQPTLGQGFFFFFFYRVTPTICTRILTHSNEWVRNARVVVKKKKKKQHLCETMRSGWIWNWIEPQKSWWRWHHVVVGRGRWEMNIASYS